MDRRDTKYKESESESDSDESYDDIGAPDFANFAKQLAYNKSVYTPTDLYFPYTPSLQTIANTLVVSEDTIPADTFKLYGNSKFDSSRKDVTTLFMFDSKDRDQLVYPKPTFFTLKPPRVYRNVVNIQLSQLKLLTSFYYFNASKGNIMLPVIEKGRESINTYNKKPLTEAIIIPEGTYVIGDLLNQIQLKMNYTPIFYDFPGGIDEFIEKFAANGDLSVNFNQPGDAYYDILNSIYIRNPTMTQIVSYYWPSQYTGLSAYSISQFQIAYYFPVLYEAVLDTTDTIVYPNLNLTVPPYLQGMLQGDSTTNYITYNSTGLNDPILAYIITANIALLDIYRINHTFRNSLVNRYQVTYDTYNLRVQIVSQTLNTSLVNLFNLTNSKNLASILTTLNLTQAAYSNIATQVGQATAVTNGMYNFIQNQLGKYFAIDFLKYSAPFFTNVNNILYIQNGMNATGIASNYADVISQEKPPPIDSTVPSFNNSPGFWPNFNPANKATYGNFTDSNYANNISSSMYHYDVTSSNFLFNTKVIDSNYYINTDKTTRTVNSLITVNPARYTIFKFRSPVRQTLQVETLPLPYYYRFADYNKASSFKGVLDQNGNNMPAEYFDLSYSFIYNSSNSLMDSSNYSTTVLSPIFGSNTISNTYTLNTLSNVNQFEFVAPYPPEIQSGLVAYNTTLTFSSISVSWPSTVQAYLYHDRGAFMADIKTIRNENSNHYIASASASNTASDLTFNFSTFAGHRYYTIFRSTNPVPSELISYSPSIYYPVSSYVQIQTDYTNFNPSDNPYNASNLANYPFVTNYNTDFLRLPVSSNLWGLDPNSSTFTEVIKVKYLPIGYDISGVSNDLTDYYGYIPGQKGFIPYSATYPLSIDPISQYTFKAVSPFDTTINSYFNAASSNRLLTTSNSLEYTFKGTSTSQVKIAHWYDGYSIPQQKSDIFGPNILSSVTSSISDYIEGFLPDANGNIQFGQGINAIGFLPTDGAYSVNSFTFKSVLYPQYGTTLTSDDPNSKIAYIGVLKGTSLIGANINISSSLIVLKYTSSVVYAPQTQAKTPGFGVEYGTWYTYEYDTAYSSNSPNISISGYTQSSNELLSYNSMYYFMPFDNSGKSIEYSRLAGSLVPYPLSQVVSSCPTYFGQTVTEPPGSSNQVNYLMPSTIANANPAYGAQGDYAYTQSQYQQSQPITTTSLGYTDYSLLQRNSDALFNFSTSFFYTVSTTVSTISTGHIGLTTNFTEYADNLFILNSLKYYSTVTNKPLTFTGARYASSISTSIAIYNGTPDCIRYLVSSPSTLQNYSYVGLSSYFSSFLYQAQPGSNTSTTIRSYEFDVSTTNVTVWMWGGGGAANSAASGAGGAGAYVKANLNIQTLYQDYGISTIYMVVGKGGNRDNYQMTGVGQQRYGGGGASILPSAANSNDGITLQGGGFSGIFMTSTLSSPILLVGGGGAGGAVTLGGPGGFGPSQLPLQYYQFSTVNLTTPYYSTIKISTIIDIDSNAYVANFPVASTIDGNLTTYWQPTAAYMNPDNFNPTVSTYRVNLQFGSNVSSFNRLRLYAELPTGLVVYNNPNKTQMLYSNTNLVYSYDYRNKPYFDATPIPQITNTTLTTNGWIVGGSALVSANMLQYSVDGFNWGQITNVGYSLPANSAMSILYASAFAKWFACGQRDKYTGTAGQGWSGALTYPKTTTTPNNGYSVKMFTPSLYIASVSLLPNITAVFQNGQFTIPSDFPGGSISVSCSIRLSSDKSIFVYMENQTTHAGQPNTFLSFNAGNGTNQIIIETKNVIFSPGDIIQFKYVTLAGNNTNLTNLGMYMNFSYTLATSVATPSFTHSISLPYKLYDPNTTGLIVNDGTCSFTIPSDFNSGTSVSVTYSIQLTVPSLQNGNIKLYIENGRTNESLMSITHTGGGTTGDSIVITSTFNPGDTINFKVLTSAALLPTTVGVSKINVSMSFSYTPKPTIVNSTPNIPSTAATRVAVSGTGQYQYIASDGLYKSSDYGVNWTLNPTYSTSVVNVAVSGTGQYILMNIINTTTTPTTNTGYISSDYGASYRTFLNFSPSVSVIAYAISYSGQYMIEILTNSGSVSISSNQKILISSNYGVTWSTPTLSPGLLPVAYAWAGTSISESGQYILVTQRPGVVYLSSDFGLNFQSIPQLGDGTSGNPLNVIYASAINASGQYMIVAMTNGLISISSQYGVSGTWIQPNPLPSGSWRSVTMSASGQYITLTSTDNYVVVSYTYGKTWVNSTLTNCYSVSMSDSGRWQLAANLTAVYLSVAAEPNFTTSPMLNSSDGLNWAPVAITNQTTSQGFKTLAYGNNTIVAGGIIDSNGGILSTTDGVTWTYRTCSYITEVSRIRYLSDGKFWGVSITDFGLINSSDGITWALVSGTSFNGSDIAYGKSTYVVAQSGRELPYNNALIYSSGGTSWIPVSPFSSTILANFTAKTVAFGLNIFVAGGSTTDGQSCIKYSGDGYSWLNANLSNTMNQTINEIKFANSIFTAVGQCPSGTGRAPNQRSILQSSDGINWSLTLSGGFNSDQSNYAQTLDYGSLQIVPNVSTLYMEIQSASQPSIYEIQALNISSIGFQTTKNALSTMIDTNLNTSYWPAESQTVGITDYSLQFKFSTLTKINTLQFYLPSSLIGITQAPAYFTGLSVVTPATGSNVFSNSAITTNQFIQVGGNSLYIASLTSTVNVSSLSIDIFKTTTSSIQISEVRALYDPNVGLSTSAGYSGFSNIISNSYVSYEIYDGGGGQSIYGGSAGFGNAGQGTYLLGGSPNVKVGTQLVTTFSTIVNGAGGGGGGYYGGGGGGSTIIGATSMGGAGGGGAGYYNSSANLLTLLDYGTAIQSNYITPGSNEQYNVLTSNSISLCNYGQGGLAGLNNGEGQHGLILITWIAPKIVSPINTTRAYPSYVDGSRLTLFQAPIPGKYDTMRVLNFMTYKDSIQAKYSDYNWVWYRSYLLLTGGTVLFPSMTASIEQPTFPFSEFPNLPYPVFDSLSQVFSNVSSFYGGVSSNTTPIIDAMKLSFDLLQYYFVNTSYTSPSYVEMTELYGLLDYLQDIRNLIYPHVNSSNSPMDRIFGGVPRFGYWANPFLKNVSYLGFDIAPSLTAPSPLAAMTGSSNPVTAMYGLVLEQSLKTGVYEMKDIMAYKPTVADAGIYSNWLQVTQFPESYVLRSLSNSFIQSNIPIQPYSMGSGISGHFPLFKYSVYTAPVSNIPIHMINDFQGANVYVYTFYNTTLDNVSSINLIQIPFTSTMIQMNQTNITASNTNILGTIVSQHPSGSSNQVVTQFGLSNTTPIMNFNTGLNNLYNSYPSDPQLPSGSVGKAINDYVGNLYETATVGDQTLYENTSVNSIRMEPFTKRITSASPKSILALYMANSNANPYYDFLVSKFTNIWQLQGTSNLSTIYGARLTAPSDFTITTNFINQVFYPTHKIILTNNGLPMNPIADGYDLINYPSYPRTEMFYYTNFSSLSTDINSKFALEQSSNFAYTDTNSGFFLNSYINNINLSVSAPNLNDKNSFNYLAIRAYSPSEMFKTLVRFYLPGRYDFGYVSLNDLSGEALIIQTNANVNPTYSNILNQFNQQFSTTQVFGANSYPGYPGSNIISGGFGSFLSQYMNIYKVISSNAPIINAVNSNQSQGISTLVNGDLQYILPSYIATRARPTDPLEFSLPFSSIISYTNSGCSGNSNTSGQYGLGYNLGYSFTDTPVNTVQRATSFFKILDDYIYLKMNPEYNMNRLDISRHEDYSSTHDPVAESQLYNCKLLLNTFGTYSTTFIQNPVLFNPPIGKLDKLSFTWYDSNGNLIDNAECDWTASLQIVERLGVSTDDSTAIMRL